MKVRIVTDGMVYRAQEKTLFGWKDMFRGYTLGYDFPSYAEAYRWIRFEFGMTAEVQRNWVLATGKEDEKTKT